MADKPVQSVQPVQAHLTVGYPTIDGLLFKKGDSPSTYTMPVLVHSTEGAQVHIDVHHLRGSRTPAQATAHEVGGPVDHGFYREYTVEFTDPTPGPQPVSLQVTAGGDNLLAAV